MNSGCGLITILCCALTAGHVSAQTPRQVKPGIEIGLGAGFNYFRAAGENMTTWHLPGGGALGKGVVHLTTPFSTNAAWEMHFGTSHEDVTVGRIDQVVFGLQALQFQSIRRATSPFGFLTVACIVSSRTGMPTDLNCGYGAGAGYRQIWRDRWAARAEALYRFWPDQEGSEIAMQLKAGIVLGRTKPQ